MAWQWSYVRTTDVTELRKLWEAELYNDCVNTWKPQLLSYETSILGEDFYIQKSNLYTLEEKAKDHIETLEGIFGVFLEAAGYLAYRISNSSTLMVGGGEEGYTINLNPYSFSAIDKTQSFFYTAKIPQLQTSLEFALSDFNNDLASSTRNFYFNVLLKKLGTLTNLSNQTTQKALLHRDYIFFLNLDDEGFSELSKKVYYDSRLDSFDWDIFDPDKVEL